MSKTLWLVPFLILAATSALSAAPDEESLRDEAVLSELNAKLAKLSPSQTVVTYASKELGVSGKLTLSYAPSEGRLLMLREESAPDAGKSYALFEPGAVTYWSQEGSQRFVYQLDSLLEGLFAFQGTIALSKGEETLTREAFQAQLGPQLELGIGVHAMGTRPALEIGLGVSTRTRATWISEIREGAERKLTLTDKEVQVELAGGKSYRLDRATGFFLSQRQVLQHSTFTLEATPLTPLTAFPETQPPADAPVEELPVHVFVETLRSLVLEAASAVALEVEGEALERLAKAHTLLAASAAQARLHHLSRSEARRYARYRLQRGATLESLRSELAKESAEFAKHLAKTVAGIEKEEERELVALRKVALAELAAGSPQAKALTAALSSERVRAARAKGASAASHLEAVLKTLR